MRFFHAVARLTIVALTLAHALILAGMVAGHGLPRQGVLAFSTRYNTISEWRILMMDVRTRRVVEVGRYGWRIAVSLEWSPDGERLTYATYSPRSDVFVIDVYTGLIRNLTNDWAEDRYPTWSPDSQRVAFYSNRDQLRYDVYIAPLDASDTQRLTYVEAAYPVWSPDGKKIVYAARASGDLYSLDTACLVQVRPCMENRLTTTYYDDRNPMWSPDGSQIAFITFHKMSGSTGDQIFVMNNDGSDLRLLATGWRFQGVPSWSPDSRSIAFVGKALRERYDSIYVVDVDTLLAPRKLADDAYYAYNERWPMWSPDSRYIAYSHRLTGGLYVVDVLSGRTDKISDLAATYPVWQP